MAATPNPKPRTPHVLDPFVHVAAGDAGEARHVAVADMCLAVARQGLPSVHLYDLYSGTLQVSRLAMACAASGWAASHVPWDAKPCGRHNLQSRAAASGSSSVACRAAQF
jgi:hypothetical protein